MKNQVYRVSLFILLLFIYQLGLSFLWPVVMLIAPNASMNVQLILNQVLCFLVPAFLYFAATKKNVSDVLRLRPLKLYNIVLIFFLSIFIQPLMSFLGLLSSFFFENDVSTILNENIGSSYLFTLFAMAVMPAVCEEIIFRGITYNYLKQTNIFFGCILTGFFFGLMHFDGQQFLYAFFMGSIFCFFVGTTGSIFSSILSHFVINGTQTLLFFLQHALYNEAELNAAENTAITFYDILIAGRMVLSSTPMLLLLFFLFVHLNKGKSHFEDASETLRQNLRALCNIPLAIILFIYFVMVILPQFLL